MRRLKGLAVPRVASLGEMQAQMGEFIMKAHSRATEIQIRKCVIKESMPMTIGTQKYHPQNTVQLRLAVAFASLWFVLPPSVNAQEGETTNPTAATPKTPLQLEAEEAAARATIAKSRYEEEKAKKDLAELDDLTSDFKPEPASVTTKEKAGYYGELLSFATLEKAAQLFVDGIPPGMKGHVIVSSDFSVTETAALWDLADSKLRAFETDFPKLFSEPFADDEFKIAAAPIAGVLAALGAASQLAAFFKVKQEISGRTISPSSEALKSLLVKSLLRRCPHNLTKDSCLKPVLPEFVAKIDGALAARLDNLRQAKEESILRKNKRMAEVKAKHQIDVLKLDAGIADVKEKLKESPNDPKLKKRLAKLNRLKLWWDENSKRHGSVISEFDAFMARLEKVPEGATQTPLERLFLYKSIFDQDTKILIAKALSQGADMETSTGALRRTKISFVGGSASVFFLADLNGTVIMTDVIPTVASRSFNTRIDSASAGRVELEYVGDEGGSAQP